MWRDHIRKEFIIRAALAEEANEGWVWMATNMPSRSVVKIKDCATKRTVFCQIRNFDENFLEKYKEDPAKRRKEITEPSKTIVMSEWYRDALGGFLTTQRGGKERELKINPAYIWGWRSLRAASHHPDLATRLGTRLGVLGAWLGIVGLILSLIPLVEGAFELKRCGMFILLLVALAVTLLTGILGIWGCWSRSLAKQGV
jgi:hypothetical protein